MKELTKDTVGLNKLTFGDIVFVTVAENDDDLVAKARFVGLSKDGFAKIYIIDQEFNLVDIEIKTERIVKIEKPN